ncbi:hypothetical protein APA_385 [Pseudanabaena sp. lw0831]|nr:hypothetical protein APA_385 [Pseudanabaena sp. lw0831]
MANLFPIISSAILDVFLQQAESTDDNGLVRDFRAWLRQQIKN